jgi:hypothetical protein
MAYLDWLWSMSWTGELSWMIVMWHNQSNYLISELTLFHQYMQHLKDLSWPRTIWPWHFHGPSMLQRKYGGFDLTSLQGNCISTKHYYIFSHDLLNNIICLFEFHCISLLVVISKIVCFLKIEWNNILITLCTMHGLILLPL